MDMAASMQREALTEGAGTQTRMPVPHPDDRRACADGNSHTGREAWLRSFAAKADASIRRSANQGLMTASITFPHGTSFAVLGDGDDGKGLAWAAKVLVSSHGYRTRIIHEGPDGAESDEHLDAIPLHRILGYGRPASLVILWDSPTRPEAWVSRQLADGRRPLMPLASDCLRVSSTVSEAVGETVNVLMLAASGCDNDGVTDARVTIACPAWLPVRQVRDKLLASGYLSACWPADSGGTMRHWSVWRAVGMEPPSSGRRLSKHPYATPANDMAGR